MTAFGSFLRRSSAATLTLALAGAALAACPPSGMDGAGDNQRDDLDYYYVLTGGKFPTGPIPNGDNASGGTFRYLVDEPVWGYPLQVWNKDDWFPQNAGLALTLMNSGAIVYDNNGIEDGSHGGFYDSSALPGPGPGLYRGYCMSNNWDFTYATYFKLAAPTTFDTMIGYFDGDGYFGDFDPDRPEIGFRMNVWSATQVGTAPGGGPIFMPACVGYQGDVLSLRSSEVNASWSDTGVARIFPPSIPRAPDPIWRLKFVLDSPVTLPAGDYFFNNEALLFGFVRIDLRPGNTHNQVNTRAKQLVPIAILGDDGFDPRADVDPASVLVRGAAPLTTKIDFADIDLDGREDMVLYFRAREMRPPSAEECADPAPEIRLEGATTGGVAFAGEDSVDWTDPGC